MTMREEFEVWAAEAAAFIRLELASVRFTGRMEFHNGRWGGIYGNQEQGLKRHVDGKFEPIGVDE